MLKSEKVFGQAEGLLIIALFVALSAIAFLSFHALNITKNTPVTVNTSVFLTGNSTWRFELLSEKSIEDLRSYIDAIYMGYGHETFEERTIRYLRVLIYQNELMLRYQEAK